LQRNGKVGRNSSSTDTSRRERSSRPTENRTAFQTLIHGGPSTIFAETVPDNTPAADTVQVVLIKVKFLLYGVPCVIWREVHLAKRVRDEDAIFAFMELVGC